ncbi:MAG: family N-acetyltransferase [Myxococcaceae bacterium]|nr:family N-acetyltransferase [Myxococcaceae bacterium]
MNSRHPDVRIERLVGADIAPHLEALARLRIEVFREYPYLYEGTLASEQRYLHQFAQSPRSTLVLARHLHDGVVLGAATAMPLLDHGDVAQLASPFQGAGYEFERVCYFGESVLTRAQRGRGIGNAFFDQREASAREQGFSIAAFCAVQRPDDHPLRPANYVPHDVFWTRRGYTRRPDMVAHFSWPDVGQVEQTNKPMVTWLKELRA